ncbi:predicted protein [Phaeodactylum tricornutum CCAP 1055/1]|uniref:SWIM-type domain-containing protein n=1 Tax=Phaeodactylum tricornutum (strain CCAP 1055/1) TaxID=556484 RepID=B7GC81_PHATC|nr:predicted protein [Phaeodactylum tricornutum CCAP 1055/1]EEC43734.1 predicted protein [Phaeodactylum tricornutum CCAP 1055/1]|eukprot:XP_002184675.1 predicted protein [Phaeodactylum tricornutum CCAP 1055/1]
MTQADKLLSYLENTPEISFCAIYDDPDSPLFTHCGLFYHSRLVGPSIGCGLDAYRNYSQSKEFNMRLTITDGDPKQYRTFVDAIPTFYPLCKHKLCHWHLLYRSNLMKVQTGKCGVKATILFRVVVLWIESWMTKIETQEEYELSKRLLADWLATPEAIDVKLGGMGQTIVSQINAYMTLNSALKRRGDGVRPSFSVPKATQVINKGTQPRSKKRHQKAVYNLNAAKTRKPAYYANIRDLVDYIQDSLSKDFEAVASFVLFCPNADQFWVKQATRKSKNTDIRKINDSSYYKYMIPQFERTRIVELVNIDGTFYLVCSCGKFQRQASPCAHLYKVLGQSPTSTDVSVRWTKHWDVYLHRSGHSDLSKHLEDLYKQERPGPVFVDSGQWVIGKGEKGSNFFETSLPYKPPVIRDFNRWAVSSQTTGADLSGTKNTTNMYFSSGMAVTTESVSSTKRMFGSSAFVHNFHFYQEMSKLAGFDMEAAESMNIAMQEALEKVQANVAKRAGKMDYTIGPAITKDHVGLRLKPSYSPKKRRKPNLQRK